MKHRQLDEPRGFYDLPVDVRREGAQHMQNVLFGMGREAGILQHLLGGMGGLKLIPKAKPKLPGMREVQAASSGDIASRIGLGNKPAVEELIARSQGLLRKMAGRYPTQSFKSGVGPTEQTSGPSDLIQATNEALLKALPGKSLSNPGGYISQVAKHTMA